MRYLEHKNLRRSLHDLQVSGGKGQAVRNKITSVLGNIALGMENPFMDLHVTNHGESRIKHCIKYDFGDGYRMITIQNEKFVLLCFAGKHDLCDKWLERNRGLVVSRDNKNTFQLIRKTEKISEAKTRITSESDGIERKLLTRLGDKDKEVLLNGVPPLTIIKLMELDNQSQDEEIYELCIKIGDDDVASFVYDVMVLLKEGNIDQAKIRIDLHQGSATEIEFLSEQEFIEIQDGDTIRQIDVNSPDYSDWLLSYIESSDYQDWMLFMHPAQRKMVDLDFAGSAKLSGVSGSGKTCIIVKRAIRLAMKKPEKPILVLTLNKSLASLIADLVNYACPDEEIRKTIQVKSFFELCQKYLNQFEPQNQKLYNDVTWKLEEPIDEIWREFYRCENNNSDAEILFPMHKSLNFRKIFPEEYLRQEFDWVRSALAENERDNYLNLDRIGRTIPIKKSWRKIILEALSKWEEKMCDVGAIDYLGLATSLARHLDKIEPEYSSVLIDEVQDFGTVELKIIRNLVPTGENDIFLCGDLAQHVLPKHNSFKKAAITIPGAHSHTILKNYRNSREILQAAHEVLLKNLDGDGDVLTNSDLEILDPEYANFSTSKPHVFLADTLEHEIGFALEYMKSCSDKHKGCIAIAGFSLLEIKHFADKLGYPVLDGSKDLQDSNLFFSDLEQTKGYEFYTMCILNCRNGILPNENAPEGEWYRDACRLYVAMTRAKRDLILSFCTPLSPWIENCDEYFEFDVWHNYMYVDDIKLQGVPVKILDEHEQVDDVLNYSGRKFLYTRHAIGYSLELQGKIDELIDGQGRIRDRQAVAWKDIKSAYNDVRQHPTPKQLFGPKIHKEFLEKIKSLAH